MRKYHGIRHAVSESRYCDKNGYGLVCCIIYRIKQDYMTSYCMTQNSWLEEEENEAIVYTKVPLTSKEIKELINKRLKMKGAI